MKTLWVRFRVVIVSLLVLLPLAALGALQLYHEREEARGHLEQMALSMARLNAAEIARRMTVTERFLETLAANPDIRSLDPKRCGHWFDNFQKLYSEYSNLLTKDISGYPICSALPVPPGTKVNTDNYLTEVRHNNGFAIGIPNQGPVSKRWVVPLDYPLRDGSGAIIGTVSAPLDLLNFNPFLGENAFRGLPPGTTATLFAPDMTMLARSLEPEKWVGSRRVQVPELMDLVAGRAETARFVSQVDQVDRVHGAARVPGTAWTTLVSIPAAPYEDATMSRIRSSVEVYTLVLLVLLALIMGLTLRASSQPGPAALPTPTGIAVEPAKRANFLAFLAIVLVTLGLFGYLFWSSYRNIRAQALSEVGNVAEVLASSVEDTFERAFSDLMVFVPQLTAEDMTGVVSASRRIDLESRMGFHLRFFPSVVSYVVFDADGKSLFSAASNIPNTQFEVGDRVWFRQLRDEPKREMAISEVINGRMNRRQSLIMGRALRDSDGRFLGAIVAAIDLEEFLRRIDRLAIGRDGLVALRRTDDYSLVLRRPRLAEAPGGAEKKGPLADLIQSAQSAGEGEFTSPVDQVRRLFAFRTLPKFPFSVVVATAAEDHFAPWQQQTATSAAAAVVLLGILMLLYRHQLSVQSQLKTSEERLASQVARFTALMTAASDGIHVLDRQGTAIEVSDSFCRMLGYRRDEVIGRTVTLWDAQMSPDELIAALAAQIEKQGRSVFETVHRRKDGSVFPVEITGFPFVLDDQWVIFNSSRDISQRRVLEDRLRQTNAELEQFAYVASHDLRQPLRMVASYLELIDRRLGPALSDEIRKYLDFAVGGAKRMDRLILSLLEYSRSGRKSETFQPVALASAVEESLVNLSVAIKAADAEISVADGLPVINGDALDLTRLFQNLIGNAINYRHPDRRLVIRIGHRQEGGELIVWVADNGIGIAPEDRERVFAIFQRLAPAEGNEGTGIGLAICKKVVERHGGSIWIEEAPGGGCLFLVRLPLSAPAVGEHHGLLGGAQ